MFKLSLIILLHCWLISIYAFAETSVPNFDLLLNSVQPPLPLACEETSPVSSSTSCDVFGKRANLKLVPENWGLLATGADLLRDDPFIKNLNYQTTLGVVDSGLKLNGNPDGGADLLKNSPEVEYGNHGTHVIGIAASESFGVNPNLPAKMYPVVSSGGGASSAAISNAMKAAIDDPKVRVINMSWSFNEHPMLVDLVRDATKKGKIFIYAAGNENTVFNIGTSGHSHFMNNPSFFKVGSSSYFGTPSRFSNFGPDVTVYAPGSVIPSLDASYNKNLADTQSRLEMNGTSMAAPHFAAVLATLVNIAPSATSQDLHDLIRATAIMRGPKKGAYPFLNALLAAEVLKDSKECLAKPGTHLSCFEKSASRIKSAQRLPKKPPTTSGCDEQKQYYKDLRRYYFLTQGNDKAVSELSKLLSREERPIAEKFLFSNISENANALRLLQETAIPGIYDRERYRSIEVLSGKLDPKKVTAEPEVVNRYFEAAPSSKPRQKHPLELILAVPENFDKFLEHCRAAVEGKPTDAPCYIFLGDSPRSFKEQFIRWVIDNDLSLHPDFIYYLNFKYDENYKVLMRQLAPLTFRFCQESKKNCDDDDLGKLYRTKFLSEDLEKNLLNSLVERLSDPSIYSSAKEDKLAYWKFIQDFENEKSPDPQEQAIKLRDLLLKFPCPDRCFVRNLIGQEAFSDEPLELTRLRHSMFRLKNNHPTEGVSTQLRSFIDQINSSEKNYRKTELTLELDRIVTDIATSENPRPLYDLLLSKENRNALADAFNNLPDIIETLVKNDHLPDADKTMLLSEVLKDFEETDFRAYRLSLLIRDNPESAPLKAIRQKLMSSESRTQLPRLYAVFLNEESNSSAPGPRYQELFDRNKDKTTWIFYVNPSIVVNHPPSQGRLERDLATLTASLPENTYNLWRKDNVQGVKEEKKTPAEEALLEKHAEELHALKRWLTRLPGEALKSNYKRAFPILTDLLRRNMFPNYDLGFFVSEIVEKNGADREVIAGLIEALRPLIKDERYLWNGSRESYLNEDRGFNMPDRGADYLIESFARIGNSAAGSVLLENHPVLKELKEIAVSPIKLNMPRLKSFDSSRIPSQLTEIYVQSALHRLEKMKEENDVDPGGDVSRFMASSREMMPHLKAKLLTLKTGSENYKKLVWFMESYAQQGPSEAREVLKIIQDANIDYYEFMLLGEDTNPSPFIDQIMGLIDYEK